MNNINWNKETELNLKTLIAFSRAEQAVHQREYVTIKEGGLTVSQFAVLELLYHKGDHKICDIINKILTTSGNITVVIKNLEKEGLVTKYNDEEDKRAVFIAITDKGRKIIEEIFPKHVENINSIFNVLSEEEKAFMISIFKKLTNK